MTDDVETYDGDDVYVNGSFHAGRSYLRRMDRLVREGKFDIEAALDSIRDDEAEQRALDLGREK